MPDSAPVLQDEILIEGGRAEKNYWRDLWRYRDLFYFLSWRDLLVRYKQTVAGVGWALIQPLVTMVVFTLFGYLLKVPTGGLPRPVLVLAAVLPWQFFAATVSASSNSLVANSNLISKVYFPRLIVPLSAAATSLVDFLISALLLALLMAGYGIFPDWRLLLLPGFIALALVTALGAGLWLTALNVKYRDFRFILPFVVQLGQYASPVAYTSEMVPERWRLLYSLNPLVGIIDGFRWSLFHGQQHLDPRNLLISVALAAALLVSGTWFFRRTERTFADLI